MKRLALIIILLAAAGGGWWYWKRESAAKPPTYRLASLERGTISSKVSATGTLQAVTRITVGSQVSGIINQVYVVHNSVVKKGQILAQLDPSTYQTAITQARASVSNAESSLANAEADAGNAQANVRGADAAVVSAQAAVEQAQVGVISAKAAITSAQARVAKARSVLENARKSFEREQDLRNRELVAQAELDTAQMTLQGAEADVESAQADLANAQASLRSAQVGVEAKRTEVESARIKKEAAQELVVAAQARIRGYQAQVTQAQANLRTAGINLERTTITSPIDGVVLDVAITAGQTVAAQLQAPNLFTLAQDLGHMQVETSVDEADISKVKTGAAAGFSVDAFPDEEFGGTVTEVRQSPVATSGVVTYLVIIRTENPKGKLKPGMTATVEIVEQERKNVVKVPNEALTFQPPRADQGKAKTPALSSSSSSSAGAGRGRSAGRPKKDGARVYTLENGKLVQHAVKTGLSDGIDSELLSSDLKEGQEVVLAAVSGESSAARRPAGAAGGGGGGRRPPGMRMF
jgi:HlyD family secretion protein